MTLKFTPATKTITFGENSLVVRGLAPKDITELMETHGLALGGLFDKFTGRDKVGFDSEKTVEILQYFVVHFPAIVGHVISIAADARDQYDDVVLLPIDVQVAALEDISTLSFQMAGGWGKFVETVARLGATAKGLGDSLKNRQK